MIAFLRIYEALVFRMERVRRSFRRARLLAHAQRVGAECMIGPGVVIKKNVVVDLHPSSQLELGAQVVLAEGAFLQVGSGAKLKVGNQVFIGRNSTVAANEEVILSQGCQIAHQVTIIDTDHRFGETDQPLVKQGQSTRPIRIGAETWIGAGAVILRGTHLESHSVVAANAVVTGSERYPENAVLGGIPARLIIKKSKNSKAAA